MQDIYYQLTDQVSLTTKETYNGFTLVPKKFNPYMFLKTKGAIKESQYSTKTMYTLLILPKNLFLRYSSPMWIRKKPQFSTIKP